MNAQRRAYCPYLLPRSLRGSRCPNCDCVYGAEPLPPIPKLEPITVEVRQLNPGLWPKGSLDG